MAKLSKAKLRQLDAMSPSDRAFALFTAVEKARSAAIAEMRDEGREIDDDALNDAHKAAHKIWSSWARPLLIERQSLEENGKWKGEEVYSLMFTAFIECGRNNPTTDFFNRADLDASYMVFIGADWNEKNQEEVYISDLKNLDRTISCETISFNAFSFPGNAIFTRTQFNGNAFFFLAIFKSVTSFIKTTFTDEAAFTSSTFESNAYFINTTINDAANFNHITFTGNAIFSGATFNHSASFDHSKFGGNEANFASTAFKGNAYFSEADFNGDTDFTQADFLTHANFSQTMFSLGSNWTAINAVRAFNMARARFETQVPQFTQAHFTESPRLDNIEFPIPNRGSKTMPSSTANRDWKEKLRFWRWFSAKPGKPIDKNDIAAFTALRRIAKQGEDHETERKAFKGEMRTQRIAGDHGLPYRLFSWAYDLFTDFGGSFLRPLLLWAALTIASAFIYVDAATSPINKTEQATCDCPAVHALQLSARNALLFATAGQRPFATKSLDCLYGKEPKEETVQNPTRTGPPQWLGLFGTAQTLLSAILIFFILLALRNRFKI